MARGRGHLSRRAVRNAIWRSIFRSCRACSWRCGWKIAFRSPTSGRRRRRLTKTCQWAIFLRNHDELTLEMVTEEERDFMYRAYARESRMRVNLGIRRRLAPLLGNNRRAMELMNGLLLSLPGTPVIYYGDEIGMGDNIYLGDRDGVRTPMQWSGDRNAGFSATDPQRLILPVIIDHEYHYQTVNVENQEHNLHSMLWWMRRVISLRKQFKAFGRGTVEFLSPENPHVLAFPAHLPGRAHPGGRQSFALRAVRRTRSRALQGDGASRVIRAQARFPRSLKSRTCSPSGRICSTGFRFRRRATHRPWSRSRTMRSLGSKARPDGTALCAARVGDRLAGRCRIFCRDADGSAARRARLRR